MSLTRGCSSNAHVQHVQIIDSWCPHDDPFLRHHKSRFQDQTFFVSEMSSIHPVTDLGDTQQVVFQLSDVVNPFKCYDAVR